MDHNPELTHRAVMALWPQLPEMVGAANWSKVAAALEQISSAWPSADTPMKQMQLEAKYRDVLAPYPTAYNRLQAAAQGASLAQLLLLEAANIAERLDDSALAERLHAELINLDEQRLIIEGGVGLPAHSFKLGNLDFKFWNLAAAAAGVLLAMDTLSDTAARPFALAAAVLLIISKFGQTFAREIGVDDTSVFLGMVSAAGESRMAALPDIITTTNAARSDVCLEPLTDLEVRRSLTVLHQLRSIEKVDGTPDVWRVIEEHGRVSA